MSYCPNKSSQEWKDLVSKVGENKAYLEWFLSSIREQKSDLEKDEDVQFKKTTDPKLMKILRQYNYDQSGFFKYQVNKFQLETILKNAGYDFQVMKSQYGSPYLASNGKFLKVSFNRSESEASDEISEAAASTLVKALSDKLGIKYNFVTKAQARDLLEAEGKVYNDESAFYYRGQTYFTEFNLDDSIHEFSHPLFDALESVNPRLLWTLISSILETDEGKAINKEVASLYKEDFIDGVPSIRALKEIGVRALTAAAKKNINPETGKPFLAAIKRLFLAFKQALRDIFGKDIKISELNENTTLQELADMLTIGKGKLDLTSLNIKPGVQELFDSNPELASIGTVEQYSQYLDSIFPESQVKDISYHTSLNVLEGDKFDKEKSYLNNGYIYFAKYKGYIDDFKTSDNEYLYSVILNMKNTYIHEYK